MNIADYRLPPRSTLPSGGNPDLDEQFVGWMKQTVAAQEQEYLDRAWLRCRCVPVAPAVKHFQLLNHMLKWANAPEGTYNHRVRWGSVRWIQSREQWQHEAVRYCREKHSEQLETTDPDTSRAPHDARVQGSAAREV